MSTPGVAFRGCADGPTMLENACFLLEPTADRVLLRSRSPNQSAEAEYSLTAQLLTGPKERKNA